MTISEVKKCFGFKFAKDVNRMGVSLTKENALKLREHGWVVSFHTDYYLNFCGIEMVGDESDFSIGFYCWVDHLEFWMNDMKININDRKTLNTCIDIIEGYRKLKQ